MSENAEQIERSPDEALEAPSSPSRDAGTEETSGNGASGLTKEHVLEALKEVLDPELGINIVDLGLVYEVGIDGDTVHITYTLTTMGCPIGPLIETQMQQLLAEVPGVDNVEAEMVLRPPWTPEMMSEEAKAALGYF
jgi:metal-sulfur cluster biosynthetic enzyme